MNRALTINERMAQPRLDEQTSEGIPLPADADEREELIDFLARNAWDLDTVVNMARLAEAGDRTEAATFCNELLEMTLRQDGKTMEAKS